MELQRNRRPTRTSTRPPPFPTSAPCPYRTSGTQASRRIGLPHSIGKVHQDEGDLLPLHYPIRSSKFITKTPPVKDASRPYDSIPHDIGRGGDPCGRPPGRGDATANGSPGHRATTRVPAPHPLHPRPYGYSRVFLIILPLKAVPCSLRWSMHA